MPLTLSLEVEITLPSKSRDALIKEFERGKEGIMRVRDAVSTVDSSSARASDPADELKAGVAAVVDVGVGFAVVVDVAAAVVVVDFSLSSRRLFHDPLSEALRRSRPPGACLRARAPQERIQEKITAPKEDP